MDTVTSFFKAVAESLEPLNPDSPDSGLGVLMSGLAGMAAALAVALLLTVYFRRYRSAGDMIRHGLAASATRRARWRARLTPASAYVPLRSLTVKLSGAATQAQSNVWRHLAASGRNRRSRRDGFTGPDDDAG